VTTGHGKSWKKHNVVDFLVVSLKMQDRERAFFFLLEPLCTTKYATNVFAAGALPRTPLGELNSLQTP